MTDTRTRNPDEIERDIRQTQRDMSRTVDALEAQMTPRNLLNAVLDKAESNDIDARYMVDAARRNPLALGMIAIGGLWLVSESDARPSSLKPSRTGSDADSGAWEEDPYHRGYVEHMARCERRADEDAAAYRQRRDHARASYLMIEQRHDEDESSFRKRLDEATDKMREHRDRMTDSMRQRRDRLADQARQAGGRVHRGASHAASRAKRTYYDNPLLGGLAAAFAGAIAGAAVPATRTEEEYLGNAGEKAIDRAEREARQAAGKAREKKDELVDKADRKMGSGDSREREPVRTGQFETA